MPEENCSILERLTPSGCPASATLSQLRNKGATQTLQAREQALAELGVPVLLEAAFPQDGYEQLRELTGSKRFREVVHPKLPSFPCALNCRMGSHENNGEQWVSLAQLPC